MEFTQATIIHTLCSAHTSPELVVDAKKKKKKKKKNKSKERRRREFYQNPPGSVSLSLFVIFRVLASRPKYHPLFFSFSFV
jgi:hypothetical protein